jgi:hypothetical protein
MATIPTLGGARNKPTPVQFKLQWSGKEWTTQHIAYITNLYTYGNGTTGTLEFMAVDPGSWWMSAGKSSGKIYSGKVSEVIKQVISEYTQDDPNGITSEVSETQDDKHNRWSMMRMDPKTFILSLLDWSSSITKNKTSWVVVSQDKTIAVKELADLKKYDFGQYVLNAAMDRDVNKMSMMANSFLTLTQSKLITQGLSTVTGKYIDKITLSKKVTVDDENTANKWNANFGPDRGFKKPSGKDWSTSIRSIPEHNAGDIGVKYDDYIDGRARHAFITLLPMVMRMKLRIMGDPKFDDANRLGAGKLNLLAFDADTKPYFLGGEWMVYGFHHVMSVREWWTNVHIARLDYDALAKKL